MHVWSMAIDVGGVLKQYMHDMIKEKRDENLTLLEFGVLATEPDGWWRRRGWRNEDGDGDWEEKWFSVVYKKKNEAWLWW